MQNKYFYKIYQNEFNNPKKKKKMKKQHSKISEATANFSFCTTYYNASPSLKVKFLYSKNIIKDGY